MLPVNLDAVGRPDRSARLFDEVDIGTITRGRLGERMLRKTVVITTKGSIKVAARVGRRGNFRSQDFRSQSAASTSKPEAAGRFAFAGRERDANTAL
jgi:hypothetical protein